MRALLIGLAVGVGLSVLRAPLGVELVQFAGTSAETAAAFRAVGLLFVALSAWFAGPRLEGAGFGTAWLGGVALGFALHGLGAGYAPPSHRAIVGMLLALGFVALLLGRVGGQARDEEAPEERSARPGSAIGHAFVGAGAAAALECVARPLRWFGGGTAADEALFVSCWLLPAALAAFAFRRALAPASAARWGRALGAQGLAVGAIAGISLVALFLDPRRLTAHLSRLGIDTSEHATLAFGAWVAVPVLAICALGLGVLAAGVRRRAHLSALAVGAAAATIALPKLFAHDSPFAADDAFPLARAAVALACFGAALALYAEVRDGESALARFAACVPGLALALYLPLPKPELRASWHMQEPQVLHACDAAEGRLTVEVRSKRAVVCLDGRPITPLFAQREAERRAVHAAWRGKPDDGGARVLFVGQLGPARAAALLEVGARVVDRCSAWPERTRELEEHAFAWEGANPPAGERLGVREARARLNAGEYDFVYAPAVHYAAPGTRALAVPKGTTAAVAFSGATEAASRGFGEQVVPVATGLEQLDLVAFVGPTADLGRDAVPTGRALVGEAPWRALRRRADDRPRFHRARLARRLAQAGESADDATRLATAALALQLEAQARSSPFESPAQRVEIPREALAAWSAAGTSAELAVWLRTSLEDLAALAYRKRMVEETLEFLTPIADAHWPWPALERAIALAQVELLDAATGLERFAALADDGGVDGGDWWLLAYLQAATGDLAGAEQSAAAARASRVPAPEWEAAYEAAREAALQAGPPAPGEPLPTPPRPDEHRHEGHGPH